MRETSILLADPHRVVRQGLRAVLQFQEDLTVVGEAADGRDAVQKAVQLDPDVVLMEAVLPQLSGVEATRRIRASGSRARVLILSARGDRAPVEEALRAGAGGYLLKTSSPQALVHAIRTVRDGGSYLCPEVTRHVLEAIVGPREEPTPMSSLTGREREVLHLVAEGCSSKEAASLLGVSVKTVDSHRASLMEKLGLRKVSELVRFAIREGLVEP